MQTLLLTVASAIILAIAAAFAAPFLVDFTQWRAAIEVQAGRALGAPVSIRGPIRAELLPLPRLVLRDVSIGAEAAGTGLAVAELRGSFALGPLMRGEIVAEELTLVRPRLRLVIDPDGRPVAPPGAARPAADFKVAALRIESGVVELEDRGSGSLFRLQDVDLTGEIGGPDGPFRLDGEVAGEVAGEVDAVRRRQSMRLSFGPLEPAAGGEAVTARLRLVLQGHGATAPPGIEIDGLTRFAGGVPSFEGRATIGARANAAALSPLAKAGWSLAGRLRADRQALRFEELALTLGAAQRPVELTGSGQLALGQRMPGVVPRLDLTLAARQVDLNTAAAGSTPLAALREAGQALGPLAGLAPLGALAFSADTLLLGGAPLRELKVGFGWSPAGWQMTALEAKLPGRAALHAAGTLPGLGAAGSADPNGTDPAFAGTLRFEAEDPTAFAAWAAPGTPGLLEGLPPGALRLAASVKADSGGVALSGLDLAVGPARFSGDLSLRTPAGGRARLDATLAASALDLDPVLPAARRLLTAAGANLDAGLRFSGRGLRLAGLTADRLDLAATSAADGILVERIAVAGLGGLDLAGSGRLSGDTGRFEAQLTGSGADGLAALAEVLAPAGVSATVAQLAPLLAPLDVAVTVDTAGGTVAASAQGRLGALAGTASGRLGAGGRLTEARLGLDVADGADLLARFGVGGLRPGLGAARLDLAVSPGPGGTPLLDGRLSLAGAVLSGRGDVPTDARGVLRPALALTLDKADLARLFPTVAAAVDAGIAVPARFTGSLGRTEEGWRLDSLAGSLAGTALSGAVAYTPTAAEPFDVTLKADRLGATRLLGFATGRAGGGGIWPDGPFGAVPLPGVPARIGLALDTLDLPGGLALAPAYMRVRLAAGAVSVDEVSGRLGEAPVSGSLKLRRRGEVLEAEGHAALNGVDLTRLAVAAGAGAKPGLRGRATLVLDLSGSGRSPAALAQSLAGQGSLAVEGFELAGLDPRSLATVMAATERGNPPDARRATQLFEQALARGPLALPRFETPLSVLNGALRTGTARVTGAGGLRVAATGSLDLARLLLDASLELEDGADPRASAPPGATLSWRGPLAAPERRSDISALLAAINLRALERETRRLEAGYARPPDAAGVRPIAVPP